MGNLAHITILGGGPAGLAVGYYAKKNGLRFTIHEASDRIGGNCVTIKHRDFLFDSGAHRIHDKDAGVTEEIKKLLGRDLKQINVPSNIFYNGKLIDFPISPLNLIKKMGVYPLTKAMVELVRSRLGFRGIKRDFESFALYTYGSTIANSFLLNYSEKLWGTSCNRLSANIAGERLNGLNLRTILSEAIIEGEAKTKHLEGPFYYPKMGIGMITEKLGEFCGVENIYRNSKITRILHNHERIQAVEINGKDIIDTDEVVSTLPLNLFLQMMHPMPPEEILLTANTLRFRNVILVALFLNRESVTEVATVYFPASHFLFTRIYEPKNRSIYMSPPAKTSLVAEVPCQQYDMVWCSRDEKLVQLISSQLIQIGWIKGKEIIDASVKRIDYAYPILEIGFEDKVQKINTYLKDFSNLKISGRSGKFTYTWIHNMMRFGDEIIKEYTSK